MVVEVQKSGDYVALLSQSHDHVRVYSTVGVWLLVPFSFLLLPCTPQFESSEQIRLPVWASKSRPVWE